MALTFTVEDGTGVTGANSYTTVAFADDYASMNASTVVAWEALTQAQKEHYLMWATHILDTLTKWEGNKVSQDNELSWPRQGVADKEGYMIESNTIPKAVKQATAFLAGTLIDTDITAIDPVRAFKKIEVDVIKLTWRDDVYTQQVAPFLRSLLAGLGILSSPGSLGFVPIVKG